MVQSRTAVFRPHLNTSFRWDGETDERLLIDLRRRQWRGEGERVLWIVPPTCRCIMGAERLLGRLRINYVSAVELDFERLEVR